MSTYLYNILLPEAWLTEAIANAAVQVISEGTTLPETPISAPTPSLQECSTPPGTRLASNATALPSLRMQVAASTSPTADTAVRTPFDRELPSPTLQTSAIPIPAQSSAVSTIENSSAEETTPPSQKALFQKNSAVLNPATTTTRQSGMESESEALTKQQLEEIFDRKLSALKVYVLESEITQAQQAIKSVVELASF